MNRLKIKKGTISQKINNKISIFDGEKSTIYTFSDSATFIFERIKLNQKEDEIIMAMVKNYQISPEIARKDYLDFINELKSKKIAS